MVNLDTFKSLQALVKIPPEWFWSYSTTPKAIFLTYTVPSLTSDGQLLIKTVRIMDSQIVSYHYHGVQVFPHGFARKFTSLEHLGEMITAFSFTRPCSSIQLRALKEVAFGSRIRYNVNRNGDLTSPQCKLVADKGHHCIKCRNLIRSLMSRKMALQKQPIKRNMFDKHKQRRNLENCRRKIVTLKRKATVHLDSQNLLLFFFN